MNGVAPAASQPQQDSGIQVYNGSDRALVARNASWSNGDHGIDTNKSVSVSYLSNTVTANRNRPGPWNRRPPETTLGSRLRSQRIPGSLTDHRSPGSTHTMAGPRISSTGRRSGSTEV